MRKQSLATRTHLISITGNEINWDIVADNFKKCIDCDSELKDLTQGMTRKEKNDFTEEFHENDNCNNHTHLYQSRKSKIWHDSNNNCAYGVYVPKNWIIKGE